MGIIEFIAAYRATATQLTDRAIARQWHATGISPREAAAWADLGYLPGEAAPKIAAGVTAAQARIAELPRDATGIWRNGRRIV